MLGLKLNHFSKRGPKFVVVPSEHWMRIQTFPFTPIICLLCDAPNIEDETHFLFHCKFYTDNRKDLFSYAESKVGDFRTLDIQTKFQILMSTDIIKKTSEFISNSMEKRRRALYKTL